MHLTILCAYLGLISYALLAQSLKNTQALYHSIAQQIFGDEFEPARDAARKAWQSNPNSEMGWRFRFQYVETLIALDAPNKARSLLTETLPPQFSALQPRYDYLKAYIGLYLNEDWAPAAMRVVISEAHAKSDAEVECDALTRLQSDSILTASEAQAVLERANEIAKRNHLEYQQAYALNQLGSLFAFSKFQYADAIAYYRQAIGHAEKIKANFIHSAALQNMAVCFLQLGDFGRALNPLLEAEKLLPTDDRSLTAVFLKNSLGNYYSLRQDNQTALTYYRQAFATAKLTGGTSKRYIFSSLNLAQGLIQINAVDEAQKYNDIGDVAVQKALHWKKNIDAELIAAVQLNRADIASRQGDLPLALQSFRKSLQILNGNPGNFTQVLTYAGLANTEDRLHNVTEARKNFRQALASIEANRALQVSAQYQITFLSALLRFYQQYEDFLIRQQDPWGALVVADSSRASVLTQSQSLTSSRVVSHFEDRILAIARQSNTAFLFYSLEPTKSYLWAITPDGKDFKPLTQSASDIEREVNAYSSLVINGRKDTLAENNQVGMRLYDTLVAPIASQLHPNMRVVIIPDGALHNLNFETLLVKGITPHYWLEDITLSVAPSLAILLAPDNRKPTTNSALVIGDADYSGSSYPSLDKSRAEIDEVSKRFPTGSTILTRQHAVPEAYQNAKPESFSLIHLSAHVDADPNSPLDSAIILSPGQDGNRKLYARDFKILNADLVTISGCSSVGKIALSGEGLVGFAWAAFNAGARNAVTSLWEVDARSTSDLMDTFYEGVAHGDSYADALRQAKLRMLKKKGFNKPFYWAPFQLYSRNIAAAKHPALH